MQLEWEFGQMYPNNTAFEAVRVSRLEVGPPDEESEATAMNVARANIWMKYHQSEARLVLDEESAALAAEFAAKHKTGAGQEAVHILATVAETGYVRFTS